MIDYELNRELRQTKKDKELIELEINKEQKRIAHLLKTQMGKDIKDVLSGKQKVKLSFKETLNYKVKYILNKIFNTF